MGGIVGLNYMPLFKLMDESGLSGKKWWRVFRDVQHMESAAMTVINK